MKCFGCGHENREGAKFCRECAAPLANATSCPKCGTPSVRGQKFCDSCGHRLNEASHLPLPDPRSYTPSHLADRILAEQAAMEARGAVDGERKTITALFADIKGSVELIEGLDPEEARAIVDPALQLMMDAVHRYEGYVAQSRGDGIFALFGAPIAQEDHARRALYAALRIQEDIKRYSDRLRIEKGVPLIRAARREASHFGWHALSLEASSPRLRFLTGAFGRRDNRCPADATAESCAREITRQSPRRP